MNADIDTFNNALEFDDGDDTALQLGDQVNAKSFTLEIALDSLCLTFDAEVCSFAVNIGRAGRRGALIKYTVCQLYSPTLIYILSILCAAVVPQNSVKYQ